MFQKLDVSILRWKVCTQVGSLEILVLTGPVIKLAISDELKYLVPTFLLERMKTDPVSEMFCSAQNTKQRTNTRNPVTMI